MNDAEIHALVGALAPVLKGYVESAVAPALARIAVLEGRPLAPDQAVILAAVQAEVRKELDGEISRGASILLAPVLARVDQLEARAPVPGPQGDAGKDADPVNLDALQAALQATITRQVQDAVAAIPPAAPGKDAEPVDLEALQATITRQVQDAVAAIPPAAPGKPGRDAPSLVELEETLQRMVSTITPAPGKDGIGLAGAMVNREGHLVVTFSNGEHTDLGLVIGKDGKDGTDGITWDFDDFTAELDDDGRTLVLGFKGGDGVVQTKYFRLALPIPIDRGVYKPGEYKRGDAVSWGGSLWIAQKDTDQQPEAGTDWRLAVKRGRNGNDHAPKPPKPHTPVKLGE